MKYYDIKLSFTLNEEDYKRYNKNIDMALNLILPYGADYECYENEYEEE